MKSAKSSKSNLPPSPAQRPPTPSGSLMLTSSEIEELRREKKRQIDGARKALGKMKKKT